MDNSTEEKPNLITVEDFLTELQDNFENFTTNMNYIHENRTTFQQWYEIFGSWLEIGTDMEKEYWGPRKEEKE